MKLSDLKLKSDYLLLDDIFYHEVKPEPLNNPHLISANPDAADLIGLDHDELHTDTFVNFVNGTLDIPHQPYAMCYAGHQFGFFVPRLGDGRAINLGEINGWHLQLKGAGITRYSRSGDGRAVLRSSIREYLMSEAMYGLHIPTTRALAIIGSTHRIYREDWESGAIVLRISPTWIRFGSFEYFYHAKKHAELEQLADYTIKESFPHLLGDKDAYIKMFTEVVESTAVMIAKWMGVGFNHGVMNTDNMSITGLTIDYGPYAFLDEYDFDFICNHTDKNGRYSFGNQPQVGKWNLSMLMNTLSPLVNIDKMQEVLDSYEDIFNKIHLQILLDKTGLQTQHDKDTELISTLFAFMQNQRIDYSYFFRTLSHYNGDREDLLSMSMMKKPLEEWLDLYDARLKLESQNTKNRLKAMKKTNPKYVLKNYMLQEAIDKADSGDFSGVEDLMILAKAPFDEHMAFEHYAKETPLKHKNLKLSCSS
jgi:uncharacterized protein YdiU (UPF0061 family)